MSDDEVMTLILGYAEYTKKGLECQTASRNPSLGVSTSFSRVSLGITNCPLEDILTIGILLPQKRLTSLSLLAHGGNRIKRNMTTLVCPLSRGQLESG